MIWKYSQGQIPRFGINWWLDEYGFGLAFHFPVWIYLSSYWDYPYAAMLFGFCLKTIWVGLDFNTIKFTTAVNLAKRISGFLKHKILVWALFHSFSIIAKFGSRSVGKQTHLYSLRELREKENTK